MSDIFAERAIAIFGMMFWLAFPIGLFISIIRQHREALPPSLVTGSNNHPFGFAYYETSDEPKPHSDEGIKHNYDEAEEEVSPSEESSEEENGALHYLKGREKLHREDNHPTSN